MEITIKSVSKDIIDDFLYFFDNIAFTDNEDWSGCYCCFYHFDDEKFDTHTREDNRRSAIELIGEDKMRGYLAYLDGKPIGWCNVNDKASYARLMSNREIWDSKEEKICSIVCFTIAPEYRMKGVATQILNKICSDYTERGYEYIEAYPLKGELTSALHYHGPLSMYMKAGFFLHKSFDRYNVVRKKL